MSSTHSPVPTQTCGHLLLSQFKAGCSPPGSPSQRWTGAHHSQVHDHCWHRPPGGRPPVPLLSRPAGTDGSPGATSLAVPDTPGSAGPAAWVPLPLAAGGLAVALPPGVHGAASGPLPAVKAGKSSAEGRARPGAGVTGAEGYQGSQGVGYDAGTRGSWYSPRRKGIRSLLEKKCGTKVGTEKLSSCW